MLIWAGGSWAGFGSGSVFRTPNYLGDTIHKKECPVDCRYTGDKTRMSSVDGIIFEAQPLASYGDEYLRKPILFPQRRPGQYFINFGYEQQFYFPLYADPGFLVHIDVNMTYDQNGTVPITFTCSWGGGTIEDFAKPHPPKTKGLAFMATNCGGGGASFRTIYLKELMKYTKVDSLGGCMHNADLPEEMQHPIYDDHGTSMRWKIKVFQDYKYVLTFENNNVTDYVTEKLPCVFAAGALPVYMGAPNIQDWLPGKKSIIDTSQFKGAKDLAEYINHLNENDDEYESYFAWKKEGLSPNFKDKYDKCVFYGAECRLCMKLAEMRNARNAQMQELDKTAGTTYGESDDVRARAYALSFTGDTYVEIPHSEKFDQISTAFSVAAYVRPTKEHSMRIVDKSTSNEAMDGFSFDLEYIGNNHYARVCAGTTCVVGTRPLSIETWYYITAVFAQGGEGIKIWINGFLDVSSPMFAPVKPNSLPVRIGSAAGKSNGDNFEGKIDDVSIWNIVLDEKTINRNGFSRMAGNEPGLIGYWSFNDGGGEVVHDWSRNALHGTIHGKSEWVDADMKPLTLNPCW